MSSMRLMVWVRFSSSLTLIFFSSFHEKLSSSSRSIGSPFLVRRFSLLVGSKRSWNAVLPTSRFLSFWSRSEEHTSELQSLTNLVCRLLLEKKKIRQHRELHKTD